MDRSRQVQPGTAPLQLYAVPHTPYILSLLPDRPDELLTVLRVGEHDTGCHLPPGVHPV